MNLFIKLSQSPERDVTVFMLTGYVELMCSLSHYLTFIRHCRVLFSPIVWLFFALCVFILLTMCILLIDFYTLYTFTFSSFMNFSTFYINGDLFLNWGLGRYGYLLLGIFYSWMAVFLFVSFLPDWRLYWFLY